MKRERKKGSALYLGILSAALLAALSGCGNRQARFLTGEETAATAEPSPGEEMPNTEAEEPSKPPQKIFVDVCGAVAKPGVYELAADSRVFHAINAAGGFLDTAASEYVNRAEPISDGEQVYVPSRKEMEGQTAPVLRETADPSAAEAKVNLNTADKEQLMTLTGIGEAKAEAILAYREESGGFQTVEDILNVSGIKEGTLEKIKDDITVE